MATVATLSPGTAITPTDHGVTTQGVKVVTEAPVFPGAETASITMGASHALMRDTVMDVS